ncbi:hypothetical protein PHLCEN_2v238 [Hermanssonia centrifuga]|uniref:Uncharacterized protein n=1 Tax=Hermanssonia centrifuga TaxID=98765 RepID=A0A2R6S6Q2_9APHY|nr:hypothetical protein PHLCEN_2v238 [Hermanssonia centrifuga]
MRPVRTITDAGIPCLVWGEDALALAHCVPTVFFDLQVIVPDDQVEAATLAILDAHPYYQRSSTPSPQWLEYKLIDPAEPYCFVNSTTLRLVSPPGHVPGQDDPTAILIHPQSHFYLDVRDHTRSLSLSPPLPLPYAHMRFPTIAAMLDAYVAVFLDPPLGYYHYKYSNHVRTCISYLCVYNPIMRAYPRILPNGKLEPGYASVVESLSPENRPYFESYVRNTCNGWWLDSVKDRRDILEKMGYPAYIPSA